MTDFAIRVASRQGIGHLMRMKWLARALIDNGSRVIFIIDTCSETVWHRLQDDAESIYFVDTQADSYDELFDAEITNGILSKYKCQHLLIDSYHLGKVFEQAIDPQVTLTVFDDLAREHDCDNLFDMKWCGEQTAQRYADKLPSSCHRYLGPEYALLAPDYQQFNRVQRVNVKQEQTLLVALGGGGDLLLVTPFVQQLAQRMPRLRINLVVGPQAINVNAAEQLSFEQSNIVLVDSPNSLIELYRQADLFVGALGTSLYELAACGLPAITFSIADNQQNNILALEDLGHFFHLNSYVAEQGGRLAELTEAALTQLPRIGVLQAQAKIKIDGLGASRVAAILLGQAAGQKSESIKLASLNSDKVQLTDKVAIRPVTDLEINRYLNARNLLNNTQRMTISKKIPRIEHYLWWLKTERVSYVLSENERDKLYIWDSKRVINRRVYLYGGWFSAAEEVPFTLAMLALKWQLQRTKADGRAVWLAVIHKDNKFVNLLNEYMGFRPISCDQELSATQQLFPFADQQHFNYVSLACKDIDQ